MKKPTDEQRLELIEQLTNQLANRSSIDDSKLIYAWNDYLESQNYSEDILYPTIEDLAETFGGDCAEAIRATHFGELSHWNAYAYGLNVYGNIVSYETRNETGIELDTLAEWLIDEYYDNENDLVIRDFDFNPNEYLKDE